jgi:hypothetical protein
MEDPIQRLRNQRIAKEDAERQRREEAEVERNISRQKGLEAGEAWAKGTATYDQLKELRGSKESIFAHAIEGFPRGPLWFENLRKQGDADDSYWYGFADGAVAWFDSVLDQVEGADPTPPKERRINHPRTRP